MSEEFDDLLASAVAHAASVARAPGATAARRRGRQRRARQRLAASTAFVALLGGAGTIAASSLGGPAGVPTANAAHSTSATDAPTDPGSWNPSSVPTTLITGGGSIPPTSAGGTPSGGLAGSGEPSGGSSQTGGPTGSPATSLPPAASVTWLTPSQVPFDSLMNWTAGRPSSCSPSMVFLPFAPNNCGSSEEPSDPHPAAIMSTKAFVSAGAPTGNGVWTTPSAFQEVFTYASAAEARESYAYNTQHVISFGPGFTNQYAVNTGLDTVATSTATAQTADSEAIYFKVRDTQGNPAEVYGLGTASDFHFYFAVKGNAMEVLEFYGGPAVSGTSNDPAILATVASALH